MPVGISAISVCRKLGSLLAAMRITTIPMLEKLWWDRGEAWTPTKKNAKPVLSESGYRSHTPMKCSVVYSNQNKVHVDHV